MFLIVLIPLFLGLGFERGIISAFNPEFAVLIPLFLGLGFERSVVGLALYAAES